MREKEKEKESRFTCVSQISPLLYLSHCPLCIPVEAGKKNNRIDALILKQFLFPIKRATAKPVAQSEPVWNLDV